MRSASLNWGSSEGSEVIGTSVVATLWCRAVVQPPCAAAHPSAASMAPLHVPGLSSAARLTKTVGASPKSSVALRCTSTLAPGLA